MPTRAEMLLEAEKRGLLPPDKLTMVAEARKRGLLGPALTESKPESQMPPLRTGDPEKFKPGVLDALDVTARETGNLIAGGVKGASQIGSTILRLTRGDTADESTARRQAVTNALVSMGADPQSLPFTAGQIGTEIAGTAAIPFGGAKLRLMQRIARSALGGGAAAGLIDPSQAGTGAAIGAAIPVVGVPLAAAGRGVRNVVNSAASLYNGTLTLDSAAKIAQRALDDPALRQTVIDTLRASGEDVHAGQALSNFTLPRFQALIQGALQRNPKFLEDLAARQQVASEATLADIAGGSTREGVRSSADLAKDAVNNALVPVLNREIGAANTAGQLLPGLTRDAASLRQAASNSVTDVGRFAEAGKRATSARTGLTYPSHIIGKADEVATKSANDSLLYGEAARFKESAIASLESHGLKPLTSESITSRLDAMLRDPKVGPDPEVAKALTVVRDAIKNWTDSNGIIDAWALDTIRKKGVNAVVTQLLGGASRKEQRSLAASVTAKITPMVRQAIEGAGGKDYGAYLDAYSKAMGQIAEQKLAGKALEMFKTNKNKFIELVQGDNPKAVEKIFGPGQYKIAQEVSERTMDTLREQAAKAVRDRAVSEQATAGQKAIAELLGQELFRFRLPSYLSIIASSTNKALDAVEATLNQRTKDALTKAFQTPGGAANLLERLPLSERNDVLKALGNPKIWSTVRKGATRAATVSTATSGSKQNERPRNALLD